MGKIYKITNTVNGKIYIGKTTQTLEKRFKDHVLSAKRFNQKDQRSRLYTSMRKHGVDKFIIECVEECPDEQLNEKEKFYIIHFNTLDPNIGYNISPGGLGGPLYKGHHHSEETKKKLSENNYWKLHGQPKELVEKRRNSYLKNSKRIQCLDDGLIYNNRSDLQRKYGGSCFYALKNQGRYRGKFYVYLEEPNLDGYTLQQRQDMIKLFISNMEERKRTAINKMIQTNNNKSLEQKKLERDKRLKTISQRNQDMTEEEKQELFKRRSETVKKSYANLSEEKKQELSIIHKECALKYHKNRPIEEKEKISKKISDTQKGKKYYINIITKEIKIILVKDLYKYDVGNTWLRCHKDGTIWQE